MATSNLLYLCFLPFSGVFELSFLPRIHLLSAASHQSVRASSGSVHGRADLTSCYKMDPMLESKLEKVIKWTLVRQLLGAT